MEKLNRFFEKFQNRAVEEIGKRTIIVEIIKEYTKVDLDMKDISIQKGTIKVKANHSAKSEIFLKKEKILKKINENLPKLKINNIS